MYAVATAANLPVLSLCLRSVQQPRIPDERNADRAPVHQSDAQRIVRNIYVFDALVGPRCQNTHARPPIAQSGDRTSDCSLRSSLALNPRLRAKPTGSSQNFADKFSL